MRTNRPAGATGYKTGLMTDQTIPVFSSDPSNALHPAGKRISRKLVREEKGLISLGPFAGVCVPSDADPNAVWTTTGINPIEPMGCKY